MQAIWIGDTAMKIRLGAGDSQREAADRLGITNVHLCDIERGHSRPSLDLLERYQEEFGSDPYVLAYQLAEARGEFRRAKLEANPC